MVDVAIDVSVVIGFKDWGLERLELSVQSLTKAFGNLQGEVIISDFGSNDWEPIRELAERHGAVYHRSPQAVGWSRSRAINAGYGRARGRILVATDADMLFSPCSMELIAERIDKDPNLSVVLQCRDLPEGFSHENSEVLGQNWSLLETVSQIRPRWGMGGMFAATRERVLRVGGYDNRMHTYGGEDLDFAQRIRRSGSPILWIEDPRVRMYHIWHPPTISTVGQSSEGAAAIEFNRSILKQDQTWKRNNEDSEWRIKNATPTCSVLVHVSDEKYLCDMLSPLVNQSNVNLDIQLLTSLNLDNAKIQSIAEESLSTVRIIEEVEFEDQVRKGLAQARSPFMTLIDERTFIDMSQFNQILSQFAGSVAATVARTVPLDVSQQEPAIVEDSWGTAHSRFINSFLVCRTDIAQAISLSGKSAKLWSPQMLGAILLLDGTAAFSDSVAALSIQEGTCDTSIAVDNSLINHPVFQPSELSDAELIQTSKALMAEILPEQLYVRGILLRADEKIMESHYLSELPKITSWSMITDESDQVLKFEAFIPTVSPSDLVHYRSLGFEIEHLTSTNMRQKHLLASVASRVPVDHAFRYLLSMESDEREKSRLAVIFNSHDEKDDMGPRRLTPEEGDFVRTVNVDGKKISFTARHCSTPESISKAEVWLSDAGNGMPNGFLAPTSMDVLLEIMNSEGASA